MRSERAMDGKLEKRGRTGTPILTVSSSGDQVTGTLNDPSGQSWQIEHGKVENSRITFEVMAREHGGTKNIHFFGEVVDDDITLNN